ncbi:hypothetical protein IX51_02145 [uncultured archaeon]|nr:hypothetical protein IX51_02145 [uncultured archaeon]
MPKHFISKKELKSLKDRVDQLGLDPETLANVEVEEIKDEKCYFVDKKPFIYEKGKEAFVPTLFLLNEARPSAAYVSVDDGAVPHVMNGANVFAQGITEIDMKVKTGDMVFVRNKDGIFLAVGIAERDAREIMENRKGEAVKLIHYPDDRIFKTFYK